MLETYVACRGEKKIKKFFLAWLSILRKFLNIDDMSSHNRHVDSSLHRSTSNIKSSIYLRDAKLKRLLKVWTAARGATILLYARCS